MTRHEKQVRINYFFLRVVTHAETNDNKKTIIQFYSSKVQKIIDSKRINARQIKNLISLVYFIQHDNRINVSKQFAFFLNEIRLDICRTLLK